MTSIYTHFILDEQHLTLYDGEVEVAQLGTWKVMNAVADGLEPDTSFGRTADGDCVVPYLDCGEEAPEVVGYYFVSDIEEDLAARGWQRRPGTKESVINLVRIFEED